MPGTVRSDAWNREILRRILVHNEFCSQRSPPLGRSSPLQFSENSFCAQRNPRFFLLDKLEALPIYALEICKVHFATRRRGNVLCWFPAQIAPYLFSTSRNSVRHSKNFLSSFYFILKGLYRAVLNSYKKKHFNWWKGVTRFRDDISYYDIDSLKYHFTIIDYLYYI